MTFALVRPEGLENTTWAAITEHVDRLNAARERNDLAQMIGTAKDVVETIAKAVVTLHSGTVVPSNAKLPVLLANAHEGLDRAPGHGASAQPPLREVAQGAKIGHYQAAGAAKPVRHRPRTSGHP
jgi:hypothetical protein